MHCWSTPNQNAGELETRRHWSKGLSSRGCCASHASHACDGMSGLFKAFIPSKTEVNSRGNPVSGAELVSMVRSFKPSRAMGADSMMEAIQAGGREAQEFLLTVVGVFEHDASVLPIDR